MSYSNRSLRRRPRIERRVLAILRGENDPFLDHQHAAAFTRLRVLASRQGLIIQDADARYLGDDELTLLSWLAAAQRVAVRHLRPQNRRLAAVLTRCAVLLEKAGLRLYPFTLYGHRLQDVT
jgi:hypothetical protein